MSEEDLRVDIAPVDVVTCRHVTATWQKWRRKMESRKGRAGPSVIESLVNKEDRSSEGEAPRISISQISESS